MLIEYASEAMKLAEYEKLEDGAYTGRIPACQGTVAFDKTLYACQEQLRAVLEGWLLVKIRHGDSLPVIGGINLNKMMPSIEKTAHG